MTYRMSESEVQAHQRRVSAWRMKQGAKLIEPLEEFGVVVSIELPSLANQRIHPLARHRQAKRQRNAIAAVLPNNLPALPVIVTLTRIGIRKLDSDNLAISFKHVRDEIAKAYGVDDGSDQYEWRYAQEKGKGKACRIEIVRR
jgi:hypothetical protein